MCFGIKSISVVLNKNAKYLLAFESVVLNEQSNVKINSSSSHSSVQVILYRHVS